MKEEEKGIKGTGRLAKGRRKDRNEGGSGERWNEGHRGEEVVKGLLSAPLCY